MSEMIERVAAVLSAADDEAPMPTYQEVARRIIAAIREPTEAMRVAGANGLQFWIGGNQWSGLVHGDADEWPGVNPGMTDAFNAMIDAALSDDEVSAAIEE